MWLSILLADIQRRFVIGAAAVIRIVKSLPSRVRAGAFVAPVMMVNLPFSLIHKIESRLSYLTLRVWNSHALSRGQASVSRFGTAVIRSGMAAFLSGMRSLTSRLRNRAGK